MTLPIKKKFGISSVLARGLILTVLLSCAACIETDGQTKYLDTGEQIERIDCCREVDDYVFHSIEHFELGIGRKWWISSDGTGDVYPLPGREPEAEEIEGGRCGISRYALHITSTGATVFGGAFGVNFFLEPFDASQYEGISFFAKRADNSGETLFFAVSEKHTDESNGALLFENQTPFCRELAEDEQDKCDRFGAGVGLETRWKFYTVPFSSMKQRGFGREAPFLDRGALTGLNISFETGDFDIWIDDVAFYRIEQPPNQK